MTEALIRWILAGRTLAERRRRIEVTLANEGYTLPGLPRGVDLSEVGEVHWLRGELHTVRYAVVDQGGRRVYHYLEREVDHIMIERLVHADEWAIEHIPRIPQILKRGRVEFESEDKVSYAGRQTHFHPDREIYVPFRVIVKHDPGGRWYVDTFYPVY